MGHIHTPETRQALRDALDRVQRLEKSDVGICAHVRKHFTCRVGYPAASDLLQSLMQRWPDYSGDPLYPVPAPGGMYPSKYYNDDDFDKWDRDTYYGRKRWELLEWLIIELDRQIAADELLEWLMSVFSDGQQVRAVGS